MVTVQMTSTLLHKKSHPHHVLTVNKDVLTMWMTSLARDTSALGNLKGVSLAEEQSSKYLGVDLQSNL